MIVFPRGQPIPEDDDDDGDDDDDDDRDNADDENSSPLGEKIEEHPPRIFDDDYGNRSSSFEPPPPVSMSDDHPPPPPRVFDQRFSTFNPPPPVFRDSGVSLGSASTRPTSAAAISTPSLTTLPVDALGIAIPPITGRREPPVPAPRERPRPQSAEPQSRREIVSIVTSGDTEAGFVQCPPPPDDVLRRRLAGDSGDAITKPTAQSAHETLVSLHNSYERVEPDVLRRHRRDPHAASSSSSSSFSSTTTSTVHASPSFGAGTSSGRRPIEVKNSSGGYSGFGGSDADDSVDESTTEHPVAFSRADAEAQLRRTVEGLVESRLSPSRPPLGHAAVEDLSGASASAALTSGVSAEALSQIVAQAVDRLLGARDFDAHPHPLSHDRGSTHSASSAQTAPGGSPASARASSPSDATRRPRSLPGEYPSEHRRGSLGGGTCGAEDYFDASLSGLRSSGSQSSGRDSRYIAGNDTLDQLRPGARSKHTATEPKEVRMIIVVSRATVP